MFHSNSYFESYSIYMIHYFQIVFASVRSILLYMAYVKNKFTQRLIFDLMVK